MPLAMALSKGHIKSITLCAVRRLVTLLAAYLLGYWKCSIAWLLLVLVVIVGLKDHSVQRKVRTQAARDKELLILRSSVNEGKLSMDSQSETAEWLNKVIAQLWPHVLQHMTTTVKENMQSSIQANLNKYKLGGNFRFEKTTVGSVPVRVSRLEVLQESPLNEIIICADITYESECDVTFVWRGIEGGMKDFQMRGRAHLVLQPLMDAVPFVAGYHIIFPEKPAIEYKLTGVGHFLDIPGLRKIVHHIVMKCVSNFVSGGKVSETGSTSGYQMLIETSGQEKDESNTPVLQSATCNQLMDSDEVTCEQSSVSGETAASDETACNTSSPYKGTSCNESTLSRENCNQLYEEAAHDYSAMSDEETHLLLPMSGMTNRQTSVSDVINDQTSVSGMTNNQTSVSGVTNGQTSVPGVINDQTSVSGVTNNQTSVSDVINGQTSVSGVISDQTSVSGITNNRTSVPGVTVHRNSSVYKEVFCSLSSGFNEPGYYNPIPKPSRKLTVSLSDEQEMDESPVLHKAM